MPDGSFGGVLAPQQDIAAEHIRVLTGSPDTPVWFRAFDDSRDRDRSKAHMFYGTVAECWPEIERRQAMGCGAFVVVNEGGNRAEEINRVRALYIDLDDKPLPADWHAEPDFVVSRDATHSHVYWRVADISPAEFREAQTRLIDHYGGDRAVKDPSRVLRLAGTLHLKDRANPRLVTIDDWTSEISPTADDWCRPKAELLDGLIAQAKPEKEQKQEQNAVSLAELVAVLSHQNSAVLSRAEWFPRIRAIAMTPIEGDEDKSIRRRLAHEWMQGKGYRGNWVAPADAVYRTGEEIDGAFDAEEKPDGCGFGTLAYHARQAGWRSLQQASVLQSTDAGPQSRIKLMTMRDVFALPDPVELVSRMLMEHENVCLVGPPKVGKTFIALDICLSIASGRAVFDHLPVRRSGPVIYLSGEGHAGMKRRLKAWGTGRGVGRLEELPFYYNANVPLAEKGLDECEAFIEGIRARVGEPVLVVIDTMARSLGGLDENTATAANLYLTLTEGLRSRLDCTTLTLAHATNKAGRQKNKVDIDIRGSSAFAGGFDAVWTVQMNEANKTVKLSAKWAKDADTSDLGAFCFRLKPVQVEGMTHGKGGVLEFVPLTEFEQEAPPASARKLMGICIKVAKLAADSAQAIKRGRTEGSIQTFEWVKDKIADEMGYRPDQRHIWKALEDAVKADYLCYENGRSHIRAGYRAGTKPWTDVDPLCSI